MEKTKVQSFKVDKNSFKDEGKGVVTFGNALTITDQSVQKNGTSYDIPSMDISGYNGLVTADHEGNTNSVVGKVFGLAKRANRVTIDGIKFAVKESARALLNYNLLKGGFLTDFSIETFGPMPDEDGIYFNSKLVGLSSVVVGNNDNAKITNVVTNSIKEAKKQGLDVKDIENISINKQKEIKMEKVEKKVEKVEKVDNSILDAINGLGDTIKGVASKVEALEKNAFDKDVKEPEFKKSENTTPAIHKNEYASMDWEERYNNQVANAWNWLKGGSQQAQQKLSEINNVNLEALKKAGKVKNSITIEDMGNFVIPEELLSEIEGHRSDFAPLLSSVAFRETLSTQMAWLTRSGDVDMQEIDFCEDDEDSSANLKPISEYGATINTSSLSHLGAVTPICNSATRFLAADLIGDVTGGYRTDYDRKKAQLFIARLQQAVDGSGQSVTYDESSDVNSLKSFVDAMVEPQDEFGGGTYIMSQKSYGTLLKAAIGGGISGPLANLFTGGEVPMILGMRYIVVPNELLPDIGTSNTLSFTVDGTAVTIDHAIFYVDMSTFTGRVSGGLQFDVSSEAAYETAGGEVRSAYQRNELVLRGSFFRGGAVKNATRVVGMHNNLAS